MGGFFVHFLTSPATVAVSIAVVLVVKSDIGGFWGLSFGEDWEFKISSSLSF